MTGTETKQERGTNSVERYVEFIELWGFRGQLTEWIHIEESVVTQIQNFQLKQNTSAYLCLLYPLSSFCIKQEAKRPPPPPPPLQTPARLDVKRCKNSLKWIH